MSETAIEVDFTSKKSKMTQTALHMENQKKSIEIVFIEWRKTRVPISNKYGLPVYSNHWVSIEAKKLEKIFQHHRYILLTGQTDGITENQGKSFKLYLLEQLNQGDCGTLFIFGVNETINMVTKALDDELPREIPYERCPLAIGKDCEVVPISLVITEKRDDTMHYVATSFSSDLQKEPSLN